MTILPAPLLQLLRRLLGLDRAEALAAKARMRSIIGKDRAEFEAAAIKARAIVGELVKPGEVYSEPIQSEDRVRRARRTIDPGPPPVDEPRWGVYRLTYGPTADEDRRAMRLPVMREDEDGLDPWVIIELTAEDGWYRSMFPHGVRTDEGERNGPYLAIRAPEGTGPGYWRADV